MKKLACASLGVLLVVGTTLSGLGCTQPVFYDVTVEEAQNILDELVVVAGQQKIEELGKFGTPESMVRSWLQVVGGIESVPVEPPTIIDSYLIAPVDVGHGTYIAGSRVLVIEGIDSYGRYYHSDFKVSWSPFGKSIFVQNPIYWANSGPPGMPDENGRYTTPPSPTPK